MAAVVANMGADESVGGDRDSVEDWDELVGLLRFEWRMESTVGRVVSSSGVSAIGTGRIGLARICQGGHWVGVHEGCSAKASLVL